jgi:hypothetical protein
MSNQPEIGEHEPRDVSRVVPADHVQPSPDRPGRHGDVRAAVPRSVQLQLRSAHRHRLDLVGAAMHTPLRRRRQARRHDAIGLELLDLVERRPADDGVLPQHDRAAHRDRSATRRRSTIPFVPRAASARGDLPFPIAPQEWHFRQSIDYSITANYAVLDIASRYRENFLYNIYKMGKNSIERGSRDTGRSTPRRVIAAKCGTPADRGGEGGRGGPTRGGRQRRRGGDGARRSISRLLRDPETRDPRGYILPADQPDFLTATKFVNALIKTGVTVHRATAPFTVAGKQYPAGSYVVKAAQAVPAARARHVRAAGSSQRLPVPGRPADAARTTTPAGRSRTRWA